MRHSETLLDRIVVNSRVLVGKPTIRGLRISVEQILAALAAGVPVSDLLEDYPELEPADIRAVLLYATERVREERVYEMVAA
ncbi:MAG: DUF433 domain-containing protein [Chloroflexi bacterium]|nr:DUF433 domain-containing protein [Chloroflexota bacterium]